LSWLKEGCYCFDTTTVRHVSTWLKQPSSEKALRKKAPLANQRGFLNSSWAT
jgi:hypothetical protein